MLVINTTYHVSKSVEKDWANWIRSEYISTEMSDLFQEKVLGFTTVMEVVYPL